MHRLSAYITRCLSDTKHTHTPLYVELLQEAVTCTADICQARTESSDILKFPIVLLFVQYGSIIYVLFCNVLAFLLLLILIQHFLHHFQTVFTYYLWAPYIANASLEDKVQAVEYSVMNLITQQQGSNETQTRSDETQIKQSLVDVGMVQECVVKALDVKNQEDEEEMEIKKRVTSVIVHGVAESDATDTDQREAEDVDVIAAMMHEIDSDDVKAAKIVRLGKKLSITANDGNTPKPRPIKLVLESEQQKVQVLKRAKNLRLAKEGGWETVFIHQDITPKQQEARKQLLHEMRERTNKGEGDLMIFNGKIVKRRPRPGSS